MANAFDVRREAIVTLLGVLADVVSWDPWQPPQGIAGPAYLIN